MIPRIAHFVFGFRPQREAFHLLHYLCLESCRRVLQPETIHFHHGELPYGEYWDLIRPHLTLHEVEPPELPAVRGRDRRIVERYRYAHLADATRLDALIEYGGVYADMDTLFLQPYPDHLYEHPFVIGREEDVYDETHHTSAESLCNAVLMAEPGSTYAKRWRDEMPGAMNGTWSNHSGFLSARLASEFPATVHVEPSRSFFHWEGASGIDALFTEAVPKTPSTEELHGVFSSHLWAHLWWESERTDFSRFHAGALTENWVRTAPTRYAHLARRFLPPPPAPAVEP